MKGGKHIWPLTRNNSFLYLNLYMIRHPFKRAMNWPEYQHFLLLRISVLTKMKTILVELCQKVDYDTTSFSKACEEPVVICFSCFRSVNGEPTYILEGKKRFYYLHKSCAELPAEIQHPQHTLSSFFYLRMWGLQSSLFWFAKSVNSNYMSPVVPKLKVKYGKPKLKLIVFIIDIDKNFSIVRLCCLKI